MTAKEYAEKAFKECSWGPDWIRTSAIKRAIEAAILEEREQAADMVMRLAVENMTPDLIAKAIRNRGRS